MRRKTGRGPLRKVTGYAINEYGGTVEVLECGHQQYPRQDRSGETNAYRRRCWRCRKNEETN